MQLFTFDGSNWDKPINTFEDMQEYVGGYVEMVNIGNDKVAVVNDEGLIHNLPKNKTLPQFCGNVIVLDMNNPLDRKFLE